MANGEWKMTGLPSATFDLPSSIFQAQWDTHLAAHHGHLLQSWAWGELKSRFGWTAQRLHIGEAAAQILFRRLPLGLTLAYIPKGPMVNWADNEQVHTLFAAIHAEAKKRRTIFLKIEPNLNLAATHLDSVNFLTQAGFQPADTIQPRTSLVIDLNGDEAAILAAMKQKTRYNIRLAEKKGVTVRQGSAADVATFHQLAQVTATRDGFGIHTLNYYQAAYTLFMPDRCALLMAEFEGRPLAALMVFRQDRKAYYFYGASSNEHRNLMAPYLIQWAAIRWAKNQGCTHYDLWGIPDADPASLEAEFERRDDGLWGVYRFKRGFGGQWTQSIGSFDYVYNPLLYQFYKWQRGIPGQ
jgi:lipid II:glycine glycyltransferase (peptidoglycan interpeptide bridge formation enzyme)